MTRADLSGWGGTAATRADVQRPATIDDLRRAITTADGRGTIARGLGRSYGDPAQNAGGTVLDLTRRDRVLTLDLTSPSVRVEAGISLDALLRHVVPHGLWVPVLPGTRQVTIGGAIAADVHGKNHHVDGSFGVHVLEMDLMLSSGDVITLTPDGPSAALFWATVGGMGLTGVVVEATVALKRVETSFFVVDTDRTPDLGSLMEMLSSKDRSHHYSVAWFDTTATGRSIGRGVLTEGNAARISDLPPQEQLRPLDLVAPRLGRVPLTPPVGLVNRLSARAFNELWYRKAPWRRRDEIQNLTQFFHPLDIVEDWNRVYGPRGFCQYQCVVPFGAEDTIRDIVGTISASPHVSSLNVLKRFGSANRGLLSFPMAGWTLAVDLPARAGLAGLLDRLDDMVVAAGGRVYLAKDSRATSATIHRMYPRVDEFAWVRDEVDPTRVFCSDLSRRLDL